MYLQSISFLIRIVTVYLFLILVKCREMGFIFFSISLLTTPPHRSSEGRQKQSREKTIKGTFQNTMKHNQLNLVSNLFLVLLLLGRRKRLNVCSESMENSHKVSYVDKCLKLFFEYQIFVCKFSQLRRGLPATVYTNTRQKSDLTLR